MTAQTSRPEGADGGARPDTGAIAELAALGRRFCLWRWETRDGKLTKPPLQASGILASSTNPDTWCSYEEALAAAGKLRAKGVRVDGIGVMLGDLGDGRSLVGGDLDGCRDPETGEIKPWGLEVIRDLNAYTETSPSGTGVKA